MPPAADGQQARDDDDGDVGTGRLERIRRRFHEFGTEYAALPLYGTVSRRVAEDPEVAALLVSAQPGQARPVLWFAALHDLVLRRSDLPAARWYASIVGRDALPSGDPWPDVRTTVLAHADELRRLVATRTTQTNEVNRSVYVAAGLAAAVEGAGSEQARVALVELGASAGLLLGLDRYRIETTPPSGGRTVVGNPSSRVRCEGLDRSDGRPALRPLPQVVGRAGVDREPVGLADEDAVRWLRACLWPDVPGRVERFDAALRELGANPPPVRAGDLVDDVAAAMGDALVQSDASGGSDHVVVYSSWALTYVERERRLVLADGLSALADSVPRLTWFTAEPPRCVPGLPHDPRAQAGPTVLGLRSWVSGREVPARIVGVAHPHGAWLETW
ncbi:DUF2332 domain-containing protein [Terrabacter aerolatus]|uniref:DUF2332 domain-containing protein n=1 Tax=Terrabacter aerolatus TaxID=422442 RepID=A0A512D273_9MICO|nr:DUF2332 domain-containing protein [Terrabacter aerolatus]GEO30543.1 hypothetical protein TAE01_23530 [Terrabacter aerolatus]